MLKKPCVTWLLRGFCAVLIVEVFFLRSKWEWQVGLQTKLSQSENDNVGDQASEHIGENNTPVLRKETMPPPSILLVEKVVKGLREWQVERNIARRFTKKIPVSNIDRIMSLGVNTNFGTRGLKRLLRKIASGANITIMIFGGSNAADQKDHYCYTPKEFETLPNRYPLILLDALTYAKVPVKMCDHSISGVGSTTFQFKAPKFASENPPDLAILEFSANDRMEFGKEYRPSVEAVVRAVLRASPGAMLLGFHNKYVFGGIESTLAQHAEVYRYYNMPLLEMNSEMLQGNEKKLLNKTIIAPAWINGCNIPSLFPNNTFNDVSLFVSRVHMGIFGSWIAIGKLVTFFIEELASLKESDLTEEDPDLPSIPSKWTKEKIDPESILIAMDSFSEPILLREFVSHFKTSCAHTDMFHTYTLKALNISQECAEVISTKEMMSKLFKSPTQPFLPVKVQDFDFFPERFVGKKRNPTKFGWVGSTNRSEITFRLDVLNSTVYDVSLDYLRSYEHMSSFHVEVKDMNGMILNSVSLNGNWDARMSVLQSATVATRIVGPVFVYIRNEISGPGKEKVKLLGLTARKSAVPDVGQ